MKFLSSVFNTVSSSDSIAIIGGADGPTVIIVAGDIWLPLALFGLLIFAVITAVVVISKKKKKLN